MKKFSLKEILSISLDVGERMLKCGAEVSRVEKTITIIFQGNFHYSLPLPPIYCF